MNFKTIGEQVRTARQIIITEFRCPGSHAGHASRRARPIADAGANPTNGDRLNFIDVYQRREFTIAIADRAWA